MMPRAAHALRLAAAPTFAVLALLTGGARTDMLCLTAGTPLDGMSLMYGLMCVFHLAPWLQGLAPDRR
jgi:hypothetical protein